MVKCKCKMICFFRHRLKFLLSLLWILRFEVPVILRLVVLLCSVSLSCLWDCARLFKYLTLLPCLEKYPIGSRFMGVDVQKNYLAVMILSSSLHSLLIPTLFYYMLCYDRFHWVFFNLLNRKKRIDLMLMASTWVGSAEGITILTPAILQRGYVKTRVFGSMESTQ